MDSVLFVCMGNICRSPMAEGVMATRLAAAGLDARIRIDSAGTEAYHVGEPPDPRAVASAAARGIDIGDLRARQVADEDFDRFDLVLAMDLDNIHALLARVPMEHRDQVRLLLDFAATDGGPREVPDPYYGGPGGFERVLDLIEAGVDGVIAELTRATGAGGARG